MVYKIKEMYSIQEALDNLATIAGLDMEAPPLIGLVKGHRIVTNREPFGSAAVIWLGEELDPLLEVMDITYRTIHNHLVSITEHAQMNWDDQKAVKGISAMMALVSESAIVFDQYFSFRTQHSGLSITERPEYQDLMYYYQNYFSKQMKIKYKEYEPASEALVDVEAVKKDRDYELFYLRKEDGGTYYNADILRSLKLTVDFSIEVDGLEEDPLLKIRSMQDRDLQASASQILTYCHDYIEDFYKATKKLEHHHLSSHLRLALIALFLAANPRNLIQNTMGKSCLQYYEDFCHFLRAALRSVEYQKMIAYLPETSDKQSHILLDMTHVLCFSFFSRAGGIKQETIGLIHRIMRKAENQADLPKASTVWTQCLFDDEKFRTEMAKFPNGPLFKIFDLVREAKDEDQQIPFDPILQNNFPMHLFHVRYRAIEVNMLRLPCPITQTIINKADVAEEFKGYLRSLMKGSPQKQHLIINFQDRTSWKEYARCRALEQLQNNAEFRKNIHVVTLPKATDFYYQNFEYFNMDKSEEFLASFAAQFETPEECGFFFPPLLKSEQIILFVKQAMPLIHKEFFDSQKMLTRKQREDFIEIFYQFFYLKIVDWLEPDFMSFTCKDALDTSAAAQGTFFAFVQLFNQSFDQREEIDFFRWLVYAPALFIRERPIDAERFNRSLSALETFEAQMGTRSAELIKCFETLYSPTTLKKLSIRR
ncbi:MAG: hypothetical protein Q8L98_00055 [Chlamydiales bacterium]|nr:hypothetical protein [Chlamydiales bacterium]